MTKSLDDVKKKIGIDALNEVERKKLFTKFVQAGGQVIEEKQKRGLGSFDREKQKELLKKLQDKSKSSAIKKYAEFEDYEKAEIYDNQPQIKLSFWDKLSIYLKGILNSVITLNGKYVNKKFFVFLENTVIPNLQRLNFVIYEIFNVSDDISKSVRETLYSKEKYYYELLQNYSQFYNEEEFNSILYFYRKKTDKRITPKYIEEPLRRIFKKIYILKDYIAGSFIALKTALTIVYNKQKKDNAILAKRIGYIKQALNVIFFQLLPKLYSLSLFLIKANAPLNSKIFIDYLEIKEEEKIGYKSYKELFEKKPKPTITQVQPAITVKTEYYKKYFNELNDEDLNNLEFDDFMKYGVKLLQSINFSELIKNCPASIPVSSCDENDKVLITYLLLKEFENEYSFILTSFKIRINPEYVDGKRVDYKDILNSIYPKLTPIYDLFSEYFTLVNTLKEIKNDKLMSEIEKYNRITALESKRSKTGFEARKSTKDFFSEIKEYLDKFIDDYNTNKKLIDNADETLTFDKEVEGEKKVDGKKVIDALVDADAFISVCIYRLEEGGDLSGISTELKPMEIAKKIEVKEEPSSQEKGFLDEISEIVK